MARDLLAAALLLAWIGLIFGRARPRLGGAADAAAAPEWWPAVTAVVPERNENATIARTVGSLRVQDYSGSLWVIVVDDGRDDRTAVIARTEAAGDPQIAVIAAARLPRGWSGKIWALSHGLSWVETPYVWLTDADIKHGSDILRTLVCESEARRLDLISLMVLLQVQSFWERLLGPPLVFFFQKLYSFPWVNDPRARTVAAAGGCLFLCRDALARVGGIAGIKWALIDDVALARAVKPGGPLRLAVTSGSRSLRSYGRLAVIWSMVARSAFDLFGYSSAALAGTILAMILVYLVSPLAGPSHPLHGSGLASVLGAVALFVAMTVDSVRRHWARRVESWKSRTTQPAGEDVT